MRRNWTAKFCYRRVRNSLLAVLGSSEGISTISTSKITRLRVHYVSTHNTYSSTTCEISIIDMPISGSDLWAFQPSIPWSLLPFSILLVSWQSNCQPLLHPVVFLAHSLDERSPLMHPRVEPCLLLAFDKPSHVFSLLFLLLKASC